MKSNNLRLLDPDASKSWKMRPTLHVFPKSLAARPSFNKNIFLKDGLTAELLRENVQGMSVIA